jgi:hypothetical protein
LIPKLAAAASIDGKFFFFNLKNNTKEIKEDKEL